MSRHTLKTDCVTVLAKPPKPPCWRDFVSHGAKENGIKNIHFTDIAKVNRPNSEPLTDMGRSNTCERPGKHCRRVRAKLHRTRSQFAIQDEDLPDEALTVNLAESKPREFGLRKNVHDDRIYLEENTRRCQTWLASIQACEPLDDVAFAQGAGVEVEVPDERCSSYQELRPPYNSSASSSDDDGSPPGHQRVKNNSIKQKLMCNSKSGKMQRVIVVSEQRVISTSKINNSRLLPGNHSQNNPSNPRSSFSCVPLPGTTCCITSHPGTSICDSEKHVSLDLTENTRTGSQTAT